jgi:hypothetical protein
MRRRSPKILSHAMEQSELDMFQGEGGSDTGPRAVNAILE